MTTLRFMTWNVHGTFNLNPAFDLEGVGRLIRKWQPDVVALQEVDSRGRKDDPFARLAESVGVHRAEARSIVTKDGDYGQMLLSRCAFAAPPQIVDVSYQEREPRRAICVALDVGSDVVSVIATHLGLSMYERQAQANALSKLVTTRHTVLMGDLNDWIWVKSVRRVLSQPLPQRTQLRTFPSRFPLLRLDRIYATSACVIQKAWTDRDARLYSDHLPAIADIEIL